MQIGFGAYREGEIRRLRLLALGARRGLGRILDEEWKPESTAHFLYANETGLHTLGMQPGLYFIYQLCCRLQLSCLSSRYSVAGRRTLSITWMTPLLASTSGATTVESLIMTLPSSPMVIMSIPPPTVSTS